MPKIVDPVKLQEEKERIIETQIVSDQIEQLLKIRIRDSFSGSESSQMSEKEKEKTQRKVV